MILYKRIVLIIVISLVTFGFVACKKSTPIAGVNKAAVEETGNIIDISNSNKKIIFANVGDRILVFLYGKNNDRHQWSLREPVTGGHVSLKKHDNIYDNDKRLSEDGFISEWRFKIEKQATFNIKFVYENPILSTLPKDTFEVKIISDSSKDALPNILV